MCKSKNGSTTAFFSSPQQYMTMMGRELSDDVIERWTAKRNAFLNVIESKKNISMADAAVVVR